MAGALVSSPAHSSRRVPTLKAHSHTTGTSPHYRRMGLRPSCTHVALLIHQRLLVVHQAVEHVGGCGVVGADAAPAACHHHRVCEAAHDQVGARFCVCACVEVHVLVCVGGICCAWACACACALGWVGVCMKVHVSVWTGVPRLHTRHHPHVCIAANALQMACASCTPFIDVCECTHRYELCVCAHMNMKCVWLHAHLYTHVMRDCLDVFFCNSKARVGRMSACQFVEPSNLDHVLWCTPSPRPMVKKSAKLWSAYALWKRGV